MHVHVQVEQLQAAMQALQARAEGAELALASSQARVAGQDSEIQALKNQVGAAAGGWQGKNIHMARRREGRPVGRVQLEVAAATSTAVPGCMHLRVRVGAAPARRVPVRYAWTRGMRLRAGCGHPAGPHEQRHLAPP